MGYYNFDSKLLSATIQAHPVGLERKSDSKQLASQWCLILGDYSDLKFPILFKQQYGSKLQDVLDTGWPSLYLISDEMKITIENAGLSGWTTFPVKVVDKKDKEIKGYHGFSIIGRCGPIDYSKAPIIEKRLVPNGSLNKYYKGLPIDFSKWDGSDFFLPENNFGIIITEKAALILKENQLTNISLKNIEEIETDISYVKKS